MHIAQSKTTVETYTNSKSLMAWELSMGESVGRSLMANLANHYNIVQLIVNLKENIAFQITAEHAC